MDLNLNEVTQMGFVRLIICLSLNRSVSWSVQGLQLAKVAIATLKSTIALQY